MFHILYVLGCLLSVHCCQMVAYLSVLGIQLIIGYHFLKNANSTEILQGMTLLMKVSMGLKKLS